MDINTIISFNPIHNRTKSSPFAKEGVTKKNKRTPPSRATTSLILLPTTTKNKKIKEKINSPTLLFTSSHTKIVTVERETLVLF
jgi:hypothetical protein